jgi:hypothetical protein
MAALLVEFSDVSDAPPIVSRRFDNSHIVGICSRLKSGLRQARDVS